jgi:3-phosphoinositide dependent protein kinase-1
MIERDCLVRLNVPRGVNQAAGGVGGQSGRGHKRNLSGPTAAPVAPAQGQITSRTVVGNRRGSAGTGLSLGDTTSGPIEMGASTPSNEGQGWSAYSAPALASPALSTSASTTSTFNFGSTGGGRRPSRSADPPEVVPERSEDGHEPGSGAAPVIVKSRPPSPVAEEKGKSSDSISGTRGIGAGAGRGANAPSSLRSAPPSRDGKEGSKERSRRSGVGRGTHPGIIRLYSTFNDDTSLCKSIPSSGRAGTNVRRLCVRVGW